MRRAAVSQKLGRNTHLQKSAGVLNENRVRRFKSHDFPGGSDSKTSAFNAGGPGSIPGSGRSPGEGNGNPFQYSCLKNPMEGGTWWAAVHGVTKSQTWLSNFTFTFKSLIQDSSLGFLFTFGQLSCFFLHTCLVHGPSPRCANNFLLRWVPPQRPMGASHNHYEDPSFFDSQEAFLHMCRLGVFLCLRSVHLSLCFSRA